MAATVRVGHVSFTSNPNGRQFTVVKGFVGVRYSLSNPKNYNGGDTAVLTADEVAALPPSLLRTISGTPVPCAPPTYPPYPFHHFADRS